MEKKLIARSSADKAHPVVDVEAPVDGKAETFTCFQGLRQIDTHHGFIDGHVKWIAGSILDGCDFQIVVIRMPEDSFQLTKAHLRIDAGFGHFRRVRILASVILIELDPEVSQLIGRIVDVGDGFGAFDGLIVIIELHINHIVGLLLPVHVPGST